MLKSFYIVNCTARNKIYQALFLQSYLSLQNCLSKKTHLAIFYNQI